MGGLMGEPPAIRSRIERAIFSEVPSLRM